MAIKTSFYNNRAQVHTVFTGAAALPRVLIHFLQRTVLTVWAVAEGRSRNHIKPTWISNWTTSTTGKTQDLNGKGSCIAFQWNAGASGLCNPIGRYVPSSLTCYNSVKEIKLTCRKLTVFKWFLCIKMKICWILAEYDYHPLDTPIFAIHFSNHPHYINGWLFDFHFELAVVSFSTFLDTCSFYIWELDFIIALPLLLLKCMLINGRHWLQIQILTLL